MSGIYVKSGGVLLPGSSVPGTGPIGPQGIQGIQGLAASGVVVSTTAPPSPALNTFWVDTSGVSVNYDAAVLLDTPNMFLKLNEVSGTAAVDSSGLSHPGVYTSSPLLGSVGLVPSQTDTSMGTTSNSGMRCVIPTAAWMNTNQFSIECLANVSSAINATNGDAFASRWGAAAGAQNWVLYREQTGKLCVVAKNTAGTTFTATDPAVLPSGTTFHVGATWDGANLVLYKSGLAVASVAVTGNVQQGAQDIETTRHSGQNASTPAARVAKLAVYGTALAPAKFFNHYVAAQ